ncbi:hypothetical protein QWY85_14455 [Neolewinella lacunae]|uniref:Uncharacterized protein n=1 Tax=Neolewinella lacunae TaxID=1517758 RepID=A0A923PFD1_9BACT|nr:hypothetical protein [Neolewinella lacunae]MBC6993047.1 hypothetical protein [Neolewinella lacunae]MDN3635869.1 hypothetical protein [Neolewinella lacunae]
MKKIVLRVDNAGVHYSATGCFPWSMTNLPAQAFRFRDREEVYWEVGLTDYAADTAALHLEVLHYDAEDLDFDPQRQMKRPVNRLLFAPLDAEMFKAQLMYYRLGELAAVLAPSTARPTAADWDDDGFLDDDPDFWEEEFLDEAEARELARPVPVRSVHFTFPFLDLKIGNGGVSGEVELPGVTEPLPFNIANDHLVAEFDAIKPYFVKALQRKTIRVVAQLRSEDGKSVLTEAGSAEIARIDEGMLELFRARSLRDLLKGKTRTVDKSLFTPEDFFESLDDDALGKALLPQDGHDLLAALLQERPARNARQLEFLSGRLHGAGQKLRYVLSPKFGFVFFAAGQDAHHFILELLDSHATYVWSIPKDWQDLPAQFRAVEREIATIANVGREEYRRSLHFEHAFWRVLHEAAESGVTDGFPRWKNRLLEGLV